MDEEGTPLKKKVCALLAALCLLLAAAWGALAQETIEVYVADGAMTEETAGRLVSLAQRALPQAQFALVMQEAAGESLRERVLADRAPGIAICAPHQARLWAQEGLLAPLDGCLTGAQYMARQVLDMCVEEESAFMAPLKADHRRMAVNRRMMEKGALDHLLDTREYPVWQPIQMQQVLEEFAMDGEAGLEIWPAQEGDADAVLALIQALYGGTLLAQDGELCQAESGAVISAMKWLQEMVECGMIGVAGSRQEALERFMAGETALFIDWTDEEARAWREQAQQPFEAIELPYPSSLAAPVRTFEVTGAAVFLSGDAERDRLAKAAVALWMEDEQAQLILGERAIWEDGALWAPSLRRNASGRALRGAICRALDQVLAGEISAEAAMREASAAAQAAKRP